MNHPNVQQTLNSFTENHPKMLLLKHDLSVPANVLNKRGFLTFLFHFNSACSDWFSGLTDGFKNKLQVIITQYLLNATPQTHVEQL